MAPAQPQDLALAHSLPQPQPQPCSCTLKEPDCAGEVSERQLNEYMKRSFVQVSRSGGLGTEEQEGCLEAKAAPPSLRAKIRGPTAPTQKELGREGGDLHGSAHAGAGQGQGPPIKRPCQGSKCDILKCVFLLPYESKEMGETDQS